MGRLEDSSNNKKDNILEYIKKVFNRQFTTRVFFRKVEKNSDNFFKISKWGTSLGWKDLVCSQKSKEIQGTPCKIPGYK